MWIDVPAGFTKLLNHKTLNWNFEMEAEDNVAGRRHPVSAWPHAGRLELNQWHALCAQPAARLRHLGTARQSRLVLFAESRRTSKKSENFERAATTAAAKVVCSTSPTCATHTTLCDAFIDAATAMGYPKNKDYNDGNQEGFGYYQGDDEERQASGRRRACLPRSRRAAGPNLNIETDALVRKIIPEGKRAVGVAYTVHGPGARGAGHREVIVSCGAVQSPGVLEHSGIGQPELLRRYGIEVKHELKGVGENYGDHFAPRMNWRSKVPITLNEQTRGLSLVKEVIKYYTTGRGALASPPAWSTASAHAARPQNRPTYGSTWRMPATTRRRSGSWKRTRNDRGDRPVPARFARLDPHQSATPASSRRSGRISVGPDRSGRHGGGHADRPQDRLAPVDGKVHRLRE